MSFLSLTIQQIQRILHCVNILAHNMRLNLRSFNVSVPKEFLQHSNIHSMFKHVAGKGMPQRMHRSLFINSLCANEGLWEFSYQEMSRQTA